MNAVYAVWPVLVLIVLVVLYARSGRKSQPVVAQVMTTVEAYWTADGIEIYQADALVTILSDSYELHDVARDSNWLVEWGQVPGADKVQQWYGTSRTAVR